MQNKRIVLDIDGTIAQISELKDYKNSKLNFKIVDRIKEFKNLGFTIILYTSRNMNTYNNNLGKINANTAPLLIEWLHKNDVPYDEIYYGKPWCGNDGFYVDDKAIRPDEFINKSYDEIIELTSKKNKVDEQKPEIILTLGSSFKKKFPIEYIETFISLGITTFRFNLSKFHMNEIDEQVMFIEQCKKKYNNIKIMIDIPFPGIKTRISLLQMDKLEITKNEELILINAENVNEYCGNAHLLIIDYELELSEFKINSKIFYDDGECVFLVNKICNKYIKLIALNDCVIYPRKSINIGKIKKINNLNETYINIIKKLKPNYVALSFVEETSEILEFLKNNKYDFEIISKIETEKGLENLDEITKLSNVMLGRGDLILNSNMNNLFYNQLYFSNVSNKNQKKFYIATGILSSMANKKIPTQSELIDLYSILDLNPNGIILNHKIIAGGNLKEVVDIINECYKIKRSLYGKRNY